MSFIIARGHGRIDRSVVCWRSQRLPWTRVRRYSRVSCRSLHAEHTEARAQRHEQRDSSWFIGKPGASTILMILSSFCWHVQFRVAHLSQTAQAARPVKFRAPGVAARPGGPHATPRSDKVSVYFTSGRLPRSTTCLHWPSRGVFAMSAVLSSRSCRSSALRQDGQSKCFAYGTPPPTRR